VIRKIVLFFILLFLFPSPSHVQAGLDTAAPKESVVKLLRSDPDGISLEYSFPESQIENFENNGSSYQRLIVPDTNLSAEMDKPQLPVVSVMLGVPPEVEIELLFQRVASENLSGSYRLLKTPNPAPLQNELQPGDYLQPEVYNGLGETFADAYYPEEPVRIVEDGWLRDQRFIRIEVFPFQYQLQQGSLIQHELLNVEVNFIYSESENNLVLANSAVIANPFEDILASSLLNYESSKTWRGYPAKFNNPGISRSREVYNNTENSTNDTLYRIPINTDGLYRMAYAELAGAGVPVVGLDLTQYDFHLTNQGRDVAIYVHDSDGIFADGDYVIFYGEKFYGDYLANQYQAEDELWGTFNGWTPEFNAMMMEKYTDENVYWLSISDEPGLDMETENNASGAAAIPESYRTMVHLEESNFWRTYHFTSEDTWFWDKIEVSADEVFETRVYTPSISLPASGDYIATLRGEMVAETHIISTNPDHHVQIYLNDSQHNQPIMDGTWDGKTSHKFETGFSQDLLLDGDNQLDLVVENINNSPSENIFLNWIEIEYNRTFTAEDNRIWFSGAQAGQLWKYLVDGFDGVSLDDIGVYEITNPLEPTFFLNVPYSAGQIQFSISHGEGTRFYIGVPYDILRSSITAYIPPEPYAPADYVFITHRDFWEETQDLANYRAAQGLSTLVVDVQDLYNLFNYGIYHPIAIKNFLASTINELNWPDLPTYALLIGDGHWNFKGNESYDSPPIFMPPNLSWVDPWQGEVDSANLLATVSGNDGIPDIQIARLPVNSGTELQFVIVKIKAYESYDDGVWQRRFLFIADDPDPAGDFSASAELTIEEFVLPQYYPYRIYLEDFECEKVDPTDPHSCPQATEVILNTFEAGALFVNYIGHSFINGWTNERLLINEDVASINNSTKLPVILSSTCLDGYWIYPNLETSTGSGSSLVEELVRTQNNGAVAAFSPTGLGVSTGHEYLMEGFYNAVFNAGVDELGAASIAAKMNLINSASLHTDLVHTFTVFGDPALKIEVPPALDNELYLPLVIR